MSFERPKDFKICMSKSMDFLNGSSDLLKKNKQSFLLKEKFKLEALMNQNPEHTELLYKVAKGQNVSATFEKLHREALDLQFARSMLSRPNIAPVFDSSAKSGREISFKTMSNKRNMNIILMISSRPKSVVFPEAKPPKFIQIKLNRKIPVCTKLKESFDQFMNGGGLLIDFITDALWPAMIKTDELRREQQQNQEEQSEKLPDVSRTIAGNDRGIGRKFESRQDGRDNHRASYQSNHRKEERNMNDKGDRIPRHNSKFSQPENSRGPMRQRQPVRNHDPFVVLFPANNIAVGGMMEKKFENIRRDSTSEMVPNGPQDHCSEPQLKGFGKPKRRSISRRQNHRASDSNDWRKPTV